MKSIQDMGIRGRIIQAHRDAWFATIGQCETNFTASTLRSIGSPGLREAYPTVPDEHSRNSAKLLP